MGFEQKLQKKRVRFTHPPPNDKEDVDNNNETAVKERIDNRTCDNGNGMKLVLGIPVNIWGTHIRGEPANPNAHPNNKLAATWTAPQLMLPENDYANSQGDIGSVHGHIDDQNRNPSTPIEIPRSPPRVQQSGQAYVVESSSDSASVSASTSTSSAKSQIESLLNRLNRWNKAADILVENFWTHLKLGKSISETIWGKLSLGAKIVTEGGVENLFKLSFSVGPSEKLLKTSACYLSTTTGPVVGLLFISTEKIAFCSDRPLSFQTSNGIAWSYYRVVIPLGRLKSVNSLENIDKPTEKYVQIQTVDNHEFWFMGFVNYQKALKYLQEAMRSYQSS